MKTIINELATLYGHRFTGVDLAHKDRIWQVLCRDFFQKYIDKDDCVLEVGSGHGEFINNIKAREKHALDINPNAGHFLNGDILFHAASASNLGDILDNNTIDVVFVSNFFEHLPDKSTLFQVIAEIYRVLRAGGRFLVLGPNIRYSGGAYWDFLDHQLPLTHLAMDEVLAVNGFETDLIIDRFLPYTTKSRLPQHPLLVRAYLKIPLMWKLIGAQFFIISHKPGEGRDRYRAPSVAPRIHELS